MTFLYFVSKYQTFKYFRFYIFYIDRLQVRERERKRCLWTLMCIEMYIADKNVITSVHIYTFTATQENHMVLVLWNHVAPRTTWSDTKTTFSLRISPPTLPFIATQEENSISWTVALVTLLPAQFERGRTRASEKCKFLKVKSVNSVKHWKAFWGY